MGKKTKKQLVSFQKTYEKNKLFFYFYEKGATFFNDLVNHFETAPFR